MSVKFEKMQEGKLPGNEHSLEPSPDWEPRYRGSDRLKGKVALITGADSGIGRAVAILFAREGADVAVAYLSEQEDAEKTGNLVQAEGRRCLLLEGDLGDPGYCQQVIEDTVSAFGGLDILVNNAGEQHPDRDITDISDHQLHRTFQTNIFSMFYLTRAARPHLKPGSSIINCTSVTGYAGSGDLLDYSATKGAITAFTRSLSDSLVRDGIRVNAVAPGPIWTPLNPCGGALPEKLESFGESTPMGRPGQPNEVAPCFLFLACRDSSYMSGQVLHPNGGIPVSS
jgi:NAD(P)-dependent dehydrogenase (short-subunit alcohol dehydrogenase family)